MIFNSVNINADRIKELMKPFKIGYYYVQNRNLRERIGMHLVCKNSGLFKSSEQEVKLLCEKYQQYCVELRCIEQDLEFRIEIYPTPLRWDFIEEEFSMALNFTNELFTIAEKYQLVAVKPHDLNQFGYDHVLDI